MEFAILLTILFFISIGTLVYALKSDNFTSIDKLKVN